MNLILQNNLETGKIQYKNQPHETTTNLGKAFQASDHPTKTEKSNKQDALKFISNLHRHPVHTASPCFNTTYFTPKVQPLPCFVFYPKPQPVVIQPSPWILRTPGQPVFTSMLPTQVFLQSYRPIQVSWPTAVRQQQCPPKCSQMVVKHSPDSTPQTFRSTKFQNVYLPNPLASPPRPKIISCIKLDQETQTDTDEDCSSPKTFHQKSQKVPDMKLSLMQFPSNPIHFNFGFPLNLPHFRNFGTSCFPFVQMSPASNTAV